jgi:hypothetical protein
MSTSKYLICTPDGVIVATHYCSNGEPPPLVQQGCVLGPAIDLHHPALEAPSDYRVLEGEVVERPLMGVTVSTLTFMADGVSECVLTNLPQPCTAVIRGAVIAGPVEVLDGALALTSTTPGDIHININADPLYKPWETTLHAT